MSTFRVYVKPFDSSGNYKPEYEEITRDVVTLGTISQQLDGSEYDLGVFRNSGFSIKLRNTAGRYSDATNVQSIFRFKRNGSQVRVTWAERDNDLICGFFNCGEEFLGEELEIFDGVLSDVASQATILDQMIDFKVQGLESRFEFSDVPFSLISNGDLASDILFACLNQTGITELLTVSLANINPNLDIEIDFVADLENRTVKEALDEILRVTNSILVIEDRVIIVKPRTPTAELIYSFYGQGSNLGIENILDIKKYRDGLNRTLNFITWKDTAFRSRDLTSLEKYGVLKKEVGSDLIDPLEAVKIASILDSFRDEFSSPKIELELDTPMNYGTVPLTLLDRVKIDHPNVFEPSDGNPLPRYGQARYGQARYPFGFFTLTIGDSLRFKILNKKIDPSKRIITFSLRRI